MKQKLLRILILLTGISMSCSASKGSTNLLKHNHKNPFFQILSASSEDWVAGVRGGGKGTEYYFKLKVTTSSPLSFDTVWVGKKPLAISVANSQSTISAKPVSFKKGDTVLLRATDLQTSEGNIVVEVKPPLKFAGAALLRYYTGAKKSYQVISNIKKLQTPNRQ